MHGAELAQLALLTQRTQRPQRWQQTVLAQLALRIITTTKAMAKDRIGTIGTRGTLNTAAKTMTTDRNMFLLPERMCVFLVQGSPGFISLVAALRSTA